MEQSFYNAYLGALNTAHNSCDYIRYRFVEKTPTEGLVDTFLPFDSYSPLRAGKRGELVGGLQLLPDKSYYGCCTSIGAAGVGVMAKNTLLQRNDGLSIEFYESGAYTAGTAKITVETAYPVDGIVRIHTEGIQKLYCRIPGWCQDATADKPCTVEKGYIVF